MKLFAALFAALVSAAALLGGCASVGEPDPQFAWVQWTGAAQPQVRLVPAGAQCPPLEVDGQLVTMHMRAAAGAPSSPTRPAWDASVCEAAVPPGASELRVGSQRLPVPAPQARRIVLLGDSGCRIAPGVAQACDDAEAWPFARVAAAAAATRPDLVVHLGDYHYREAPCPPGTSGCAGSPYGFAWEPWRADFFVPAAPLLAAAPWVFVRGNHEECARAGQGWARLLAPGPFDAQRSCDDPRNDGVADYASPYAVPIGAGVQLLIVDSAVAGNTPLNPQNPQDALTQKQYAQDMRDLTRLAAPPGVRSWFISHHPVLGFAANGTGLFPGNPALQQALRGVNGPVLFPAGVQLALHGHVHLFEALSFAQDEPPTLVAGHAGTKLDTDLPQAALQGASPAPGVQVREALHAQRFGFVLLENTGPDTWTLSAFGTDGSVSAQCKLGPARAFRCTPAR
ncbi:metallophosphoesterase [Ramlibacter agri]|uniref:metallophosphoesterase n=1 Tax=Ramlibacter agri TaxID=2728837 RepID=UPI00146EFFBA